MKLTVGQNFRSLLMTEWISVKDQFPEENQSIAFKVIRYEFPFAGFYREDEFNEASGNLYIYQNEVTHWMPLPKFPIQISSMLQNTRKDMADSFLAGFKRQYGIKDD